MIIGVAGYQFLFLYSAMGATYTWIQTDWSGGTSAQYPTHASNKTGWQRYASALGVDTEVSSGNAVSHLDTGSFSETFSGTTYKDGVSTTAAWSGGQLALPAQSATNIFGSLSGAWTSGDAVYASVYVPTTQEIFLGVGTGQLWKYNTQTNVPTNITSAVSSYLGSNTIRSLAYDSTDNRVYIGSDGGKFIKYDPSNGTVTNLTAKLPSGWGTIPILALAFDSVNHSIYLAGQVSRFARYSPVSDGIVDFTGVIGSIWTNNIMAMTVDTAHNDVYIAGNAGKFASFHISNGTGVDLTSTISGLWSTGIIYALAFDSVHSKVYIGGVSGRFGSYDSSTSTFSYLSSSISSMWGTASINSLVFDPIASNLYLGGTGVKFLRYNTTSGTGTNFTSSLSGFWGTNQINTLAIDTVRTIVYTGGAAGNFSNFVDPVSAVAQSVATDSFSGNIRSVTLTKNDTVGTGSLVYAVSNDGGANFSTVTPGVTHVFSSQGSSDLRFRVQISGNATVQDITLSYDGYAAYGTLVSSAFNSESAQNVLAGLQWSETILAGTDVRFQIRTAPDAGSAPGTWSAWMGPDGTSATYFTNPLGQENIPSGLRDGSQDQWMQYQIILTSNGLLPATVSDVTMVYIVNNAPTVGSVIAAQGSDGNVIITYQIKDTDTTSGNITPGFVTPSFQYWNGSSWNAVATLSSGDVDNKIVTEGDFTTYSATWHIGTDLPGIHSTGTYKVRVTVNDNEGANNIGTADSSAFDVDTIAPSGASVRVNASTVPATITLTATDDNPVQMRVGLSSDFSGVAWEPFSSTKFMNLVNDPSTVYAQFRDDFNNTTTTLSVTTPETPSSVVSQDVSNLMWAPEEYRIFVAWKTVDDPTPGFSRYTMYRSLSEDSEFSQLSTVNNRATNYYSDSTLLFDTVYYFKLTTTDNQGNISFYSQTVKAKANGAQDSGEGGGGKESTPPVISHVSVSGINTTQATITWNTDEIASSTVGYSVGPGVFSTETGNAFYVDNDAGIGQHSVVVSNLSPGTKYYFRVRSIDPTGNVANDDNGGDGYAFTTLPGPVISGVALVGSSNEQVTITWNTTLLSTTRIRYSTGVLNGDLVDPVGDIGSGALVSQHTQVITGLSSGTRYFFEVQSEDVSGNVAKSNNGGNYYEFTTTVDSTPPVLSDIDASFSTSDRAVILWSTNEQASSQIRYSESSGGPYASTTMSTTYDHGHYVILEGLKADTRYYYRVTSEDLSGNSVTSDEGHFTTAKDASYQHDPLSEISDVSDPPYLVSDTRAVVTLKTDQPSICTAEYGMSSKQYTEVPISETAYNTEHSLHFSGLLYATPYFYTVTCEDNLKNIVSSSEYSFTTLVRQVSTGSELNETIPPVLSNVNISNVTGESATITWDTNEETNGLVRYATSMANTGGNGPVQMLGGDGSLITDKTMFSLTHSVLLTNLVPGTSYSFIAVSYDTSGNIGESTQASFTTQSPSTISSINILSQKVGNVTLTWKTSQSMSSVVEYGLTDTYGDSVKSGTLSQDHSVTLSDLQNNQLYHFRIKGEDENKNLFVSSDYTFQPKSLPQISGVSVKVTSDNGAEVSFLTSVPTDALVTYTNQQNKDNSGSQGKPDFVQTHTIVLKGLEPGSMYQGTIQVRDDAGNEVSQPLPSFTLSQDKTPPIIDHVRTDMALAQDGKVQSIISWTTDEPATTAVVYKEGLNGEEKTAGVTTDVSQMHIVVLTSFQPGSVYYVKVKSLDSVGNESISQERMVLTPQVTQNVVEMIIGNFKDIFSWANMK